MIDDKDRLTSLQRHLRHAEEDEVRKLKEEVFALYTDGSGRSARTLALVLASLDASAIPREMSQVHRILAIAGTLSRIWRFQSEMGDPQQIQLGPDGQQPHDAE